MIALFPLVLAVCAPPVPAKRPASERYIYSVDLERALLATRDGKRVRAEFDQALEDVEKDVQSRETRVYLLRKELEKSGDPKARARYDAEVEAIDQLIAGEEKRLDEAQEKKLEPILSAMREIIRKMNQADKARSVIVDQSEHPIINADDRCDATIWLVRAYESKKEEPVVPVEACRGHVFCFVELDRLMKGLEESKRVTARLDAYTKEKQLELDTKQTELKKMEARLGARADGRAEYERARIELAARYSAYQQALADKERSEEKHLRDAARAVVIAAAKALPGAIFIDAPLHDDDEQDDKGDKGDKGDKVAGGGPLEPRCDLSAWFIDLARKTTRIGDIEHACPAFAPEKAKRRGG